MKISEEIVEQIAHLARLEFRGEEQQAIRHDLERIIGLMEKLNEVDTSDVEPLIFMTDEINRFREDEVKSSITQDEALLNAAKKDSDYFRIPKVLSK